MWPQQAKFGFSNPCSDEIPNFLTTWTRVRGRSFSWPSYNWSAYHSHPPPHAVVGYIPVLGLTLIWRWHSMLAADADLWSYFSFFNYNHDILFEVTRIIWSRVGFFGTASAVGIGCMFRSSKVFLKLGVGHQSFTNLESSESSSWCEIGIFPRSKPTWPPT